MNLQKQKQKKKIPKKNQVNLNTSNEKIAIEENEIPFKPLTDPINFVNYIG